MVRRSKRSLGKAFGDMVTKSSRRQMVNSHFLDDASQWQETVLQHQPLIKNFQPLSPWRLVPFYAFLIVILAIFIGKLVKLQIIEGHSNRLLADGNRIQIRQIHAPRGIIYDRGGRVLAKNSVGFRLVNGEEVQFIDRDTALELESQNLANESLTGGPLGRLEIDTIREYPYKESSAHLLGFVSQISKEELERGQNKGYKPGDRIGRQGVEATYERYLAGQDGKELVEVDANGEKLRSLGKVEAVAGDKLFLTIDAKLQEVVYEALAEGIARNKARKGAAVAINPSTGQVLALVSYPSYDNNLLTHRISQAEYEQLVSNPDQVFLNRAVLGQYPPGSIFKIVSALAALESGKITKETKIEDVGEFYLGRERFPNWYFIQYGRKEGLLDIVRAIARSNDIFFYRVGQALGIDLLADFAKRIGLGRPTGIDLPAEAEGLVPTPDWKEKVKNEPWFPGNTLHVAIGQGDILTTPLQLANLTSFVAADGVLYKPYLVDKVVDSESGEVLLENRPQILVKDLVRPDNLSLVKEGMKQACETGGTGWPFFDFAVKNGKVVGCKTGTAEFGVDRPHAWFTVFAPFDKPEIVLTVLVEQGGEGSSVAGPIARRILDWYFTQKEE